jgi:hypothetical protein
MLHAKVMTVPVIMFIYNSTRSDVESFLRSLMPHIALPLMAGIRAVLSGAYGRAI